MKQRIIALLMVLVLLASCFCACKKNDEHSHSFSGSYAGDETHHWHTCECGEKSEYAQHNWNEGVITIRPTTDNEGEKVFTCTVCRAKKIEKLDKLTADHTHSFTQKYHSDATNHWYECFCGEKSELAEHSFNDGVVTVKPTMDKEGVKTYTCTVCKYEKTEVIEKIDPDHEHVYSASVSDEYSHWMECFCGAVDAKAEHSFGEGEITTPSSDIQAGILTYACADCGHKKTEIIKAGTANGLSFLQSTHYRIADTLHATPLTLEAEICVDPATTGRAGAIFGNYYGIRQDWLFEIHENGVPRFYYSDAAGNVKDYKFTQVDVRTGDFVHVALTFDIENNAMSLYLDGEVKQIIIIDSDLAHDITRYQFVVGGDNRSDNGIFFRGQIRSIAAYSDVRTPEEIAAAAEKGTNLYADDLIVAYLLNKESGGKDVIDLSGNGYIIQKEWLDSHEPTLDYAYSFAVVGDTQWLSKYKPEKFEGIYDWILENKDDKKISHVFGLGDITEDWNTANKELEWVRAQEYIYKLNGIIPYSLIRGNHDETKYFNKYFATEEYMSQFNGEYMVEGDVRNSYKLFTVGSTDYLLLTLDFGASDEMLEWANAVVIAHPDRRVIVTTHGYHGFDGGHLNYDNTMSSGGISSASDVDTSAGEPSRGYNNGQQIWEKFVSKHPNIFLVLSGHTPDEDVLVLQSEGNHGNIVNQMLIDPQWMDPQKDGVGMVCMLYFSEDGTQMEVEWICTDTGKYYKERNQFALDLTDSLNAPAHSFGDSYDDNHHFQACACGYTHSEEPHVYDGGTLNVDGFMEYTCECGHKRITSATDDPVAVELQAILEKYSKGGVYFKELNSSAINLTTFYKGDRFWTTDDTDYESTANHLTLQDIVMGKYGDLRLDLGWNCYDGVYSTANRSTIDGICMFALGVNDANAGGVTKVTIEENGYLVIIKTWSGDSVLAETTIGYFATTTLLNQNGETIDTIYTKSNANGFCEIVTPQFDGLVSEYDKIILNVKHDILEKSCYYSTIAIWDGTSVSTSLAGSGTIDDPYLVQSGADLAYIAGVVNNAGAKVPNFSGTYFKMTQSIDLDGHDLFIGSYPGWDERRGFYGFFDGNHCTVRGLNSSYSLFGTIENGWLKDLSVYGKVNGTTTIGGIVGYVANGGKLENLTNYATVNGESTLGGIVGNAENQASTVINCVNYGNVTGFSYIIGGVAGSGGHDIFNCVNYGTITSTGNDCVGGITGSTKNTGSIVNCINYGTVNARGKAGGIAGSANKLISDCINYGDVNGVWALGGVVGHMTSGDVATIVNCVNNGNINGTSTGNGGILGILEGSASATGSVTIKGCVNTGSVTATWGAGGIAGDCVGEISDCVNYGKISGKGELGGIIGKCYGKVTECTNYGEINATQAIVGGIVGNLHVKTHLDVIMYTNTNEGEVVGPGAQDIIGQ